MPICPAVADSSNLIKTTKPSGVLGSLGEMKAANVPEQVVRAVDMKKDVRAADLKKSKRRKD